MYCKNCGSKLSDDAVFCRSCGARIQRTQGNTPVKQPENRQNAYRPGDEQRTVLVRPSANEQRTAEVQRPANGQQANRPRPANGQEPINRQQPQNVQRPANGQQANRPRPANGQQANRPHPANAQRASAKPGRSPLVYAAVTAVVLAVIALLVGAIIFVRDLGNDSGRTDNDKMADGVHTEMPEEDEGGQKESEEPTPTPSPSPTPTPSPTPSPTPAPTATPGARTDADYVFANSDTVYLTDNDLAGLTDWEIKVARNEIYARHGRIFQSADLAQYFGTKSWYKPTIAPDAFNDSYLNAVEKANAEFISTYEKKHNINQKKSQ